METNVIIEELNAVASLDWNPEQKAIKNHARRTGRGGQDTVRAIRKVKRRNKDRDFARKTGNPYFFLVVLGFSLYPDA